MNRPRMLEFLVRCAFQVFGGKDQLAENMKIFFQHYIKPVVDASKIKFIRREIRKNQKLNNYLVDNEYDLTRIYNHYSDNGRGDFTLNSAKKIFTADLIDP